MPGAGLAPGSLVTIRGVGLASESAEADTDLVFENPALPFELAGTGVHVAAVKAPLVRVSPAEVTFQVPFGVVGPWADALVSTPYGRSQAVKIPISPTQPGLFPGRVLSGNLVPGIKAPDTSRVMPASLPRAGGPLEVFGTGFGAVTPAGRSGLPGLEEPKQRVIAETRAWIDGREVEVVASELAQWEAGVYKVVLTAPADLDPGRHRVVLSVGAVESNEVEFQSE